jgi:hypothetical protein
MISEIRQAEPPCHLRYALSGPGQLRDPYAGFLVHCYSHPGSTALAIAAEILDRNLPRLRIAADD